MFWIKRYFCPFVSWCRIIYFGGYGCKTIGEVRNTPATSFVVEEMSWVNNNNNIKG